jgi:hypothetical protein
MLSKVLSLGFGVGSQFARFYGDDGPPPVPAPAGGSGTPPASEPPDPLAGLTPEQKRVMQDRINEAAGRARSEGKTKGKEDAEAEAARKLNEEQGQFKPLYETAIKDNEKLKIKADLAEELIAEFNGMIDDETKDWPAGVKAFDPGKDDVKKRREWVANGRALVKQMAAGAGAPNTDAGGGSGGAGAPNGGSGGGSGETGTKKVTSDYIAGRNYATPGKTKQ